jgi:hypothetical protein
VDQIDSSHYESSSVPSDVFESKGRVDYIDGRARGLTLDLKRIHNKVLKKRHKISGANEQLGDVIHWGVFGLGGGKKGPRSDLFQLLGEQQWQSFAQTGIRWKIPGTYVRIASGRGILWDVQQQV